MLWRREVLSLLLVRLAPVLGQRVTDGEIIHYSFQYPECAAGPTAAFEDELAPGNLQRTLSRGNGSSCQPDQHVGVTLNSTCMASNAVQDCSYAPLSGSSGANLFAGVTAVRLEILNADLRRSPAAYHTHPTEFTRVFLGAGFHPRALAEAGDRPESVTGY